MTFARNAFRKGGREREGGGGGGGSESVELLAWLAVGTDSTHYIGCAR